MKRLKISAIVVLAVACLAYVGVCGYVYVNQRQMAFGRPVVPTQVATTLEQWTEKGEYYGTKREAASATVAWLFMHGNGGRVERFDWLVPKLEPSASLYLVEFPGWGNRAGTKSRDAINDAVMKAYDAVVAKGFKEIGVIGESLGSGPAAMLAKARRPPDKMVLVVPFDEMAKVAQDRYPYLPVRFLFSENWDNIAALGNYRGTVEIFAADKDWVVPNKHAKNLAASIKGARYVEFVGGHGAWGKAPEVVFTIK